MWVVHWGLLLRLPWRTWFAPVRAMCGGGAAAWVTGVLAAPGPQGSWWLGQQEIQSLEGYGSQYWPIHSSVVVWRPPLSEKPSRTQSVGSQRVGNDPSDPAWTDPGLFCLWQLCPSEAWAWRWRSCLGHRDPGGVRYTGRWTASSTGVMAPSESFFFFWASAN